MDASIGSILAALKANNLEDNTVVFFTSDNGAPSNHVAVQNQFGSNSPLRGYKGSIQEGGIRMPAMVRWPGKVTPGSRTNSLAATYDIFATMLAMGGVALPTDRVIDGKDLRPILIPSLASGADGAGAPIIHDCLMQYHAGADGPGAVRCGAYKGMFSRKDDTVVGSDGEAVGKIRAAVRTESAKVSELYNVDADIGEASPLKLTKFAAVVKQLTAARDAHMATMGPPMVDQIALGGSKEYTICGDPHSTTYHPRLQNCTMNNSVANWSPDWPPAPPPPPPPPPGVGYMGCYWDKGFPSKRSEPCDLPVAKRGHCPKRDGDGDGVGDDALTLELCGGLCKGFKYFGVQNGGSGCFCGPSYGKYGPSNNCSLPCSGNKAETCGGPGCNSIWLVPYNASSLPEASLL
jgi:arylsulfatase A